jgi:hypothetical protein
VQLSALVEGVSTAGKPAAEYLKVQQTVREYDDAIRALAQGDRRVLQPQLRLAAIAVR